MKIYQKAWWFRGDKFCVLFFFFSFQLIAFILEARLMIVCRGHTASARVYAYVWLL